jgi:hypothetical protein
MIRYLSKRVMLLIAGLVFMIPLLSKPLMAKIDIENRAWRPHRATAGAANRRPVQGAVVDPEPCMEQDSFLGE